MPAEARDPTPRGLLRNVPSLRAEESIVVRHTMHRDRFYRDTSNGLSFRCDVCNCSGLRLCQRQHPSRSEEEILG